MQTDNIATVHNKNILFVSNNIPHYDCDSGSNRFKEIIETFLELGYNGFLKIEQKNCESDTYLNHFNKIGLSVIYNFENLEPMDCIWINGPNSFKKNITILKKYFPSSKIIYDMVDIHFLRYSRALSINPYKISDYKRYFKYKKIETKLIQEASIVVAISEREKEVISKYVVAEKIIVISNIHYHKVNKAEIPSFKNRKNILFIGSKHTPNVDAIYFLYNEIMPKVWEINKNIKVQIIGAVAEEIKDICHPMFEFLGYVSNIEPYFLNSKFMVAPLRYGAGVKGKVGQAFEYYLPVITTDIGAEGMHLIHNENAMIVNNSEDFANAIIDLYTNEEQFLKLSSNSSTVLEKFSRDNLKKILNYI